MWTGKCRAAQESVHCARVQTHFKHSSHLTFLLWYAENGMRTPKKCTTIATLFKLSGIVYREECFCSNNKQIVSAMEAIQIANTQAINFYRHLLGTCFFSCKIQSYGPNTLWKYYNLCTRPVWVCALSIRRKKIIMISKCCSSELDTYVCLLAKSRHTIDTCWQLFKHVYEFCIAIAYVRITLHFIDEKW